MRGRQRLLRDGPDELLRRVLGVPVAALGIAGYAAGLLFSALLRDEIAVLSGLFVALVGVPFSAYLTWLELFVIRPSASTAWRAPL